MNILDQILADKKIEVAEKKNKFPCKLLEKELLFSRETYSLKESLLNKDRTGIIAEFKRKSPSKGIFNSIAEPEVITKLYADCGASGLSVLTDEKYFAGNNRDLKAAREANSIPILRKDFVIDEYQIVEAKAIGADVILLIAECLTKELINQLAAFAKSLGLEILLEVHSAEQLDKLCDAVDMVGVNNRDLTTFTVDINQSLELSKLIPDNFLKVAESGISQPQTIKTLKQAGFHGFLIGERFMKEKDPGIAFKQFVENLK
jgi:indole-3-glycerol phosphate synthase